MPILLAVIGLGKLFADDEGRSPAWLVGVMTVVFGAIWGSYDLVFKGLFGDGERTIYEVEDREKDVGMRFCHKFCHRSVKLEDTDEKR